MYVSIIRELNRKGTNLEERTRAKLGVIIVNIFSRVGQRLGHSWIRFDQIQIHNNNNLGENSIVYEEEEAM
jgi:hypothetical protein